MLLQKLRYMKQAKKTSLLRKEALFLPVCTIVCPFAPNDVPRPLLGAAWAYRMLVSICLGKGSLSFKACHSMAERKDSYCRLFTAETGE